MRARGLAAGALLLLALVLAGASAAPALTVLEQIQAGQTKVWEFDTGMYGGHFEITVMWNRVDTFMSAALVCASSPWAASYPQTERVLRMDVGVFRDQTCLLGLTSENTAAFALNLQYKSSVYLQEEDLANGRPVTVPEVLR